MTDTVYKTSLRNVLEDDTWTPPEDVLAQVDKAIADAKRFQAYYGVPCDTYEPGCPTCEGYRRMLRKRVARRRSRGLPAL